MSQKGLQFKCLYQRRNQFRDKRISVDTYDIHNGGQNPLCFPTGSMSSTTVPCFSSLSIMAKVTFKFFHWKLSLSSRAKKIQLPQIRDIILHPLCDSWLHIQVFHWTVKKPCLETCLTEIIWSMSSVQNTFAVSMVKIGLGYYFLILPASKKSNRMQQSCRH